MIARHTFGIWAPENSPWSAWAKPALFNDLSRVTTASADTDNMPIKSDAEWLPIFARSTAIVVDLPGAEAIACGLQLARQGWRPVPLFNTSFGSDAAVPTREILEGLNRGRQWLTETALPSDAPPAFLLDSRRMRAASVAPGTYDNRWVVLPQDFPSVGFMRGQGIAAVLLWQKEQAQPADDLAHVLRRWQEGGLDIFVEYGGLSSPPTKLTVHRPSRFKSFMHRWFVLAGLRRNSAGGFGATIPMPSESSGGGWS
jgi:hypothetical protein